MATKAFEDAILMATGRTADETRRTPLAELRAEAERKLGRPIRFGSAFPWIGRGSVLRDRLVSHEDAERAFDEAIGQLD